MLAFCGKNVSLWDLNTSSIIDTFPKSPEDGCDFSDISWSCDHKCLAVLRPFGPVEILRVKDGKFHSSEKLVGFSVEEDSFPTSISFMSNSNRYLAIGSHNGNVCIWDCKANNVRKTLVSGDVKGEVDFVDFNVFGSHIAAAMSSGCVLVHEYSSSTKKTYWVPNGEAVTALRFQRTPHASLLGAGTADGAAAFWNTITGAEVAVVGGAHRAAVTDLAFSPISSKLAATVSLDRRLCFHDLLQRSDTMSCETKEQLTSLELCEDGVKALAGTAAGNLIIFDIRCLGHPLASVCMQAGSIKRLRYAQQPTNRNPGTPLPGNQSGTSVAWSPALSPALVESTPHAADLRNVMFSPLRNSSYESELSSSFVEADASTRSVQRSWSDATAGVKPERSRTPQNLHILAVENSALKSSGRASFGSPLDARAARSSPGCSPVRAARFRSVGIGAKSPVANGCGDKTPVANGSVCASGPSGDGPNFAAVGYGMFSPLRTSMDMSSTFSSLYESSTPLDDVDPRHFPFADAVTHDEISPIASAAAEVSPFPVDSTPGPFETNIDSGCLPADVAADPSPAASAAERRNAGVGGADETRQNETELWPYTFDPEAWSSTSESESCSEISEDAAESGEDLAMVDSPDNAVPVDEKQIGSTVNQPQVQESSVLNQMFQQLELLSDRMSERFDRIDDELAKISKRLARLEAR